VSQVGLLIHGFESAIIPHYRNSIFRSVRTRRGPPPTTRGFRGRRPHGYPKSPRRVVGGAKTRFVVRVREVGGSNPLSPTETTRVGNVTALVVFFLKPLTTRLRKLTSRVVGRLKNADGRKTARVAKVPAVWSEEEETFLKRPHGSSVFVILVASKQPSAPLSQVSCVASSLSVVSSSLAEFNA
jgi:hypothetical protein